MRQRHRLFTVTVKDGAGRLSSVSVHAETFQLACGAAEATVRGSVAVYYVLEGEVAGRCSKCGCFIEIHERYQCRGGVLKCVDCN